MPCGQIKSKNRKNEKYKKITCSNCSSNNIIKWGKRKTENRGKIQRYKCKNCDNTLSLMMDSLE